MVEIHKSNYFLFEVLFWRTNLIKYLLLAMLVFLSTLSLVNVAFANPIPWEPPWEGNVVQYFSIIAAEFCGLIVGTAVLTYNRQTRWRKSMVIVLAALTVSYAIGITIWAVGYMAGIPIFSPVNPFYNASLSSMGPIISCPNSLAQ